MNKSYKRHIIQFLQSHEKDRKEVKTGMELEHFIVWKGSGESVTYAEPDGIRDLLQWMCQRGWEPKREEGSIIGVSNSQKGGEQTISLEPGAQLEFSGSPCFSIPKIEDEYSGFLRQIREWLKEKKQRIEYCGYHPVSLICDVPLIPKKKYYLMDNYFNTKGKYAHNMMRGTGSTQITIDFCSETDFIRKLRLAAQCTPLFALMFSNCPRFEGQPYNGHSIRTEIWNACDSERCGIVPGLFDADFGYDRFVDYILALKPIVYYRDGSFLESGEKSFLQMLEAYPPNDFQATLVEMLRMVFTDVRVKQFLELRTVDSLPPEVALFYVALGKEIFYNPRTFLAIEALFKDVSAREITQATSELPKTGFKTRLGRSTLFELMERMMHIVTAHPFLDTRPYLERGLRYIKNKTQTKTVLAG